MKQDILEPGFIYHYYNRGNNKNNIFFETKNYAYFLELAKKYLLPVADIYAYYLLKNHFHFLFRIKDKENLTDKYKEKPYVPFSNLLNAYSKAINKTYDRSGSLFQKHPQRNRVTNQDYLIHLIVYIHLNPIKHGFSNEFQNYPYSSYQAYVSNKNTNINKEFILEYFNNEIGNYKYWHDLNKIKYEGIIEEIENIDI